MCFVGQDLFKSGRVAGNLMANILNNGSSVLAVTGSMDFQAHKDRILGFEEKLKELENAIKIHSILESYDDYQKTFDGVYNTLLNNKQIKGIYMAAGNIDGCINAVRKAGLSNIHIVCNDELLEVAKYLKEGLIDFTIVQNPFMQGYKPIKLLYEYLLLNKNPDEEFIYTDIDIKIAENI